MPFNITVQNVMLSVIILNVMATTVLLISVR